MEIYILQDEENSNHEISAAFFNKNKLIEWTRTVESKDNGPEFELVFKDNFFHYINYPDQAIYHIVALEIEDSVFYCW